MHKNALFFVEKIAKIFQRCSANPNPQPLYPSTWQAKFTGKSKNQRKLLKSTISPTKLVWICSKYSAPVAFSCRTIKMILMLICLFHCIARPKNLTESDRKTLKVGIQSFPA